MFKLVITGYWIWVASLEHVLYLLCSAVKLRDYCAMVFLSAFFLRSFLYVFSAIKNAPPKQRIKNARLRFVAKQILLSFNKACKKEVCIFSKIKIHAEQKNSIKICLAKNIIAHSNYFVNKKIKNAPPKQRIKNTLLRYWQIKFKVFCYKSTLKNRECIFFKTKIPS